MAGQGRQGTSRVRGCEGAKVPGAGARVRGAGARVRGARGRCLDRGVSQTASAIHRVAQIGERLQQAVDRLLEITSVEQAHGSKQIDDPIIRQKVGHIVAELEVLRYAALRYFNAAGALPKRGEAHQPGDRLERARHPQRWAYVALVEAVGVEVGVLVPAAPVGAGVAGE